MSDDVAGAGSGEQRANSTTPGHEEEERKKRLFLWLWFAVALLLLIVLFVVCVGDDKEEPVAPATTTTTTTTPAAAPAPTTAPTTAPVAPVATSGPTTATPPPAPTTAGASTTTTEAGPIDISGEWIFIIDVTETTGACAGEENEPVGQDTVTISQDDDILTVTGLNGTGPPWQGQIVGNTVTFRGERDEDRGRTVASFALTVDDDGTQLTGIEEWTWSGPGGSCPDSLSAVFAQRG